ncbi:MAG: hypothetical protein JSS20_08870 [Proteobacteria bacterium]|nr:hypothetical protein [Pseudomonadota bacterium]
MGTLASMRSKLLRPGSFAWLVAHDLRLSSRNFTDLFGGTFSPKVLLIGGLAFLGLHAAAWPFTPHLDKILSAAGSDPDARLAIAALLVSVASWMAAQGLFAATRALYFRGDLDLLLGSPLPARRVLGAKAMAIALSSLGSVGLLALPVANVGALRHGTYWLAVYPALAAAALAATAVSLFVTMQLFRRLGPRRARAAAHLSGALIGGGFVLVAQVIAMLPDGVREAITAWLSPAAAVDGHGFVHRLLWLPVDAAAGDPVALVLVPLFAIGLAAATASLLGDSFAQASLEAAGAAEGHAARAKNPVRFRSGPAAALRRKEWRLLLRDPSLFSQLGLQIVYTIPLAVVLVRSGTMPIAVALTPAIVVIASQVAASLAWIAVSGEDAPELIAAAPVKSTHVDAAKLSAIALPVLVVLVIPVAVLAISSPWAAMIAFAFAVGGSISTSLLNLWHPMPGNRRGMLRRHSQSKLIGLVEHLLAILWAIAAVLALVGTKIAMLPVGLAVLVLASQRTGRSRTAGDPVGLKTARAGA